MKDFWRTLFFSFPVQLLWLNIKKNQLLLLCWFLLFIVVTGNFAKALGIPFLFLDPEYLESVNFTSFFIVGLTLGGFTMAYNIACYILDGPEFKFLGILSRPFTKFAINNSIIPLAFLLTYIISIVIFQMGNEYVTAMQLISNVLGLLFGVLLMCFLLLLYFWYTNKDIFKMVALSFENKFRYATITRINIMQRLRSARQTPHRVQHYLDQNFRWQKVPDTKKSYYNREAILKVFDQNHLNSVIIELVIFLVIFLLGVFRDNPYFQIPAAASTILLLTIIIMFVGALTYWFRGWVFTTSIVLFVIINLLLKTGVITSNYKAHGLDYNKPPVGYSLSSLEQHNDSTHFYRDKQATLEILNNWHDRMTHHPNIQSGLTDTQEPEQPKMVFICASGGGQRAALWTLNVLQTADSITHGALMNHARLITGASGGIMGAAYFRELVLNQKLIKQPPGFLEEVRLESRNNKEIENIYSEKYLDNMGSDMLNPVIFSLVVNDLFIRYQEFEYNNHVYKKGRGYAFEKQLNNNTGYIMDKSISDYHAPEKSGLIPMMLISPTIMNDGRKLYISPQHVSYMNRGTPKGSMPQNEMNKGIDFLRFFQNHDAEGLRFLTALRMSATFPYVTPSVSMPTKPLIKIMDAGMTDNYGISDAVRFLYVFREWIAEHTSEVVFVVIRDSDKKEVIKENLATSLFEKLSMPIGNFPENWFNVQDMNNDDKLEYAESWFNGKIKKVSFEYTKNQPMPVIGSGENPQEGSDPFERASLSWHLTSREKESIKQNIYNRQNQQSLQKLKEILQ